MQNTIIENMRLEMNAPKIRSNLSVRVGDVCTRTVHFILANRGSVVDLKNALTAQIHIKKPDGNMCYNDCVIAGNEIQYTLTSQTINVVGICLCNISVVFEDGAVVISPEFEIVVYEQNLDSELIESQNEFQALHQQVILAKNYADSAGKSSVNASESEEKAKKSKESAAASASTAVESAERAKESEEMVLAAANRAGISAAEAQAAEKAATEAAIGAQLASEVSDASAIAANRSAELAEESARAAEISAAQAKVSETALGESEANAKASEEAARVSASEAAESAAQAKKSDAEAAASANSANASAGAARASSAEAATSASEAAASETNALSSKDASAVSERNAANSAKAALDKATAASQSAGVANTKATEASGYATEAESWAHGGTNTRENENIDNARYYYEQSRAISESFSGTLRPMGTVTFEQLPALSTTVEGDMYNISNQFTTNDSFKEGTGNVIPAGANVYKTSDGYWDVLAGSPVTGIKGNAESSYRRGNVNITAGNIGALPSGTKYAASASVGGPAVSADSLNAIPMGIGADLNTIKTNGFYWCAASGTAETLKNSPTGMAFFMIVGKHAGTYQEIIEYLPENPKRFFRNYYEYGNRWGNWYEEYTSADKPTKADVGLGNVDNTADANKDVASANKVNAVKLTNQNLNDFHSGTIMYYAGGGNTCLNKPPGIDNFGMFVLQSAAGWFTQGLYGSDDNLYTRRYDSNGWTAWKRTASKTELDTHSENKTIHIKGEERTKWNGYEAKISALEKKIAELGYPVSGA